MSLRTPQILPNGHIKLPPVSDGNATESLAERLKLVEHRRAAAAERAVSAAEQAADPEEYRSRALTAGDY